MFFQSDFLRHFLTLLRPMLGCIVVSKEQDSGPTVFTENETIAKYAIMDGAPVGGESIPIRVCLSGYGLTPTMRDIPKKFLVRYFLNLVLVDEEEIFQATGPNVFTENETIAKYAIMDGAPVGGESIPIRVCLSSYGLTPTMRDIAKKFLVRYFLNLVIVDEEEIFQATGYYSMEYVYQLQ
ncbi:hypothetical protein QYM36_001405 [Artemia franciscana]|uniref:Uncharacterized protein n=1 Tax=Artemia franciscana TaxID=6661 RepID=A0AA88IAV8_ARTSF|nr:hypothetical protein QYM36_001405 [Artemia franciscana]